MSTTFLYWYLISVACGFCLSVVGCVVMCFVGFVLFWLVLFVVYFGYDVAGVSGLHVA